MTDKQKQAFLLMIEGIELLILFEGLKPIAAGSVLPGYERLKRLKEIRKSLESLRGDMQQELS